MKEIRRFGFLVTDSESLTQYSTLFQSLFAICIITHIHGSDLQRRTPPKSVAIVYGWHTRVFSITYFFRGKQNTIENMIRIPTVCISASDFVTHILTKKNCAVSVGIMYDGEHKPSPVANANASKIVFAMHTIIRSSTP